MVTDHEDNRPASEQEASQAAAVQRRKEREVAERMHTVTIKLTDNIAISTNCAGNQLAETIDYLASVKETWHGED